MKPTISIGHPRAGDRACSNGHDNRVAGADGIPTLLEILYAQEDLWVLRSIMGVIERANEGATTRFSAAVKEIHTIEMGRNAARSRGKLVQDSGVVASGDVGVTSAVRRSSDSATRNFSRCRTTCPQSPFMASSQNDTADMRYVDKNYEPLSGERLRGVMKAEDLDPADATLAVAKRMPVRMRFRVDQRKLNRVLAECASAELTIEVRQLRINPESSEGSGPQSQPLREQPGRLQTSTRRLKTCFNTTSTWNCMASSTFITPWITRFSASPKNRPSTDNPPRNSPVPSK